MAFRFGPFVLDTEAFELRRAGEVVHVEPQVFDVLCYLVENRDRVVLKEELLDHVWGDRFVSESALTSRVKAVRSAVDDDGRDQGVIRTIHGRGYRFVAAVDDETDTTPALLERAGALAALQGALTQAASGSGRVVLVAGEPGIGKTSVVRSFAASAATEARVLFGGCDDLATPRLLGPLHDIAPHAATMLPAALEAGRSASTLHDLVLAELRTPPNPCVLVVEDIHWADDATLDLLTVVCRRIGALPAVVVLTLRDTEPVVARGLDRLLGALPPAATTRLDLEPLSAQAVTALVGDDRADAVMAATGGNPFFVAELAAMDDTPRVPPLVSQAVLARVARQPATTRDLLDLVAVVPGQVDLNLLDELRPEWPVAAEAAEEAGLVTVRGGSMAFRHELARRAVLDASPASRRRRHHAEVLAALIARDSDAAWVVHHADAASDDAVLAAYALPAARRAAAVGSHREAHAHYQRALRFLDQLAPDERAEVLEQASHEAYAAEAIEVACRDATAALERFDAAGDRLSVGRLLRWRSRINWYLAQRKRAEDDGHNAVRVLEPLGASSELAWAYSNLAQLAHLAWDDERALAWGHAAIELAKDVDDGGAHAHALVNVGAVANRRGSAGTESLEDAFELADRHGERHEATRALLTIAYQRVASHDLEAGTAVASRALAYAEDHEVGGLAPYLSATLAWAEVLRGEWESADARLERVLATGDNVSSLLASTVLAQLQVRRGNEAAEQTLADAWRRAEAVAEQQRLAPLAATEAERRWMVGELTADSPHLRSSYAAALDANPTVASELGRWLHRVAPTEVHVDQLAGPTRAEVAGAWAEAAAGWAERNMPYDRALALAAGNADARAEARAIAEQLGARPLMERLG